MTREDANNKFYVTFQNGARDAQPGSYNWCQALIAALESVGALKLDDPEEKDRLAAISYLEEKFVEVQSTGNARNSERLTRDGAAEVLDILLKSGFKITR